ncbi:MAG TPA: hypothetical protein VK034_15395, partial [Enhygromyxa sp.]|nr:hypothetical protein [Enhygromyxa sp.]
MHRSLGLHAVALAGLCACGRVDPGAEAKHEPASPPAAAAEQRPERHAAAMPETFAGFPQPELANLDGVWLVDARQPRHGVAWMIEAEGSKLTILDRHGRETVYDVTLGSPCALRLIDADGVAETRSIALSEQRLIVTSKGAVAVAAPDGSMLACFGHRTYQIAADGRCRYTTETLAAWTDPVEADDACELEIVDGARSLIIAGQRLREHDGVWLDEVAAE